MAADKKKTGWLRGRLARALRLVYAARIVFVWLLFAIGLAVTIAAGWKWYALERDNRIVTALLDGQDVEIDPDRASSQVLFARAYYLLKRDRVGEAQVQVDQANFRGTPEVRVLMLYDTANVRLRQSFEAIDRGQFDKATSLVNLAKDGYDQALRIDPKAWDVKYNLDVAARLVRDLPVIEPSDEPEGQEPPKNLWTDLPGIPKGEP